MGVSRFLGWHGQDLASRKRATSNPVISLQALVPLVPGAYFSVCMATHWLPPKTLQEGHKKQPCNPTDPALMVGIHPGEQACYLCTKPQQFCMSAACHLEVTPCFAFLLFTGLILSSFSVTPAHLCFTFCSCLSPLLLAHHQGHTSYPQGDNCVIPHQTPPSKEKHVVVYSGAFTWLQALGPEAWPGQPCWSPGRSWQTGAGTAR